MDMPRPVNPQLRPKVIHRNEQNVRSRLTLRTRSADQRRKPQRLQKLRTSHQIPRTLIA